MKRILFVLCALLGISSMWAKECKITYENEGFLMVVMNTSFQSIENGSTVPEGTDLMIALSCNNGFSLKSFLINGVEHKDELGDYAQEGRDFQYRYTVTEDTHFEAISEVMTFPVVYSVSGNGALELYAGEKQLQSGDILEYDTEVQVKAVPKDGSQVIEFMVNGEDNLSNLLKNNHQMAFKLYGKTTFEIKFTGEGEENEFPVVWSVTGDGQLNVKCGTTVLASGDKVIKGDYIDVWPMPADGYFLESIKVNGEDRTQDMENKLTVQVEGSVSLEAVFVENAPRQSWLDLAADAYAGGDGTEQAPYQIATAEQLARIAKEVYDGTDCKGIWFELTADIDLAGNDWFPIGFNSETTGEHLFDGNFDGKGFAIQNLVINPIEGHSSAGLFGATGSNFVLRNLTIESGNVLGTMIVGAFAGFNRGLIENCINKAKVACEQFYCAGIAGSNSRSSSEESTATIRRCQNFGTVVAGNGGANGLSAAGIVASSSSVIEECVNWGEISAPTSGAGGITAILEAGVIRHCFNRGYIHSVEQVAGIAGAALGRSGDCEIYNCYSASELSASIPGGAGGIVGVAIFQNTNALKVADSYFDSTLYDGEACGELTDFFGKFEVSNLEGMDTQAMKAADFLTRLNNESRHGQKWSADSEQINGGYPVLAFMNPGGSAIDNLRVTDSVWAYASDGQIAVEGAKPEAVVQVYSATGVQMYAGTVKGLASCHFEPSMYVLVVDGQTCKVLVR